MAIAIDFGTSNTVVARWNQATQQPETLSLPGLSVRVGQNPPLIPSLAYVEDAAQGQVIVGQAVRDRGLDLSNDSRFFHTFKRGIGTEIQGFLPELDGQKLSFEQVGQWFLQQILQQLQTSEPEISDSLILTVPVDSFETYRHWLGQVCQSLQVNEVRLIDEPTAAALGYGVSEAEVVLAVDFGGGTLDLSLVRLYKGAGSNPKPLGFLLKWGDKSLAEKSTQRPQMAQVLAKVGKNLGGSDIDGWLAEYFAKEQGIPITPLTLRLAERLKIQLSLQTSAQEVFFDDETLDSYELNLDRDRFEAILEKQQFFQTLETSMEQLLQQARRQGLEAADIDAVLLVGGTVQIPTVQAWVQRYFDAEKIRCSKPFEAIAQGALQVSQGVELRDFLYHSYGIRYWDRRYNRHNWHPIIRAGQPYPMQDPVELRLGASVENQPKVELILGELGSDSNATEVYFDGGRLVTRTVAKTQPQVQALNASQGGRTIAQLDPPGHPGSDRIKVLFLVDSDGFLRITVEDLLTHQTLLQDRPVVQLS